MTRENETAHAMSHRGGPHPQPARSPGESRRRAGGWSSRGPRL